VGNLPYNISTPILFHLLGYAHLIADQHFMLQKEVIDRMVAKPATSDYSRLSVMLQWRYDMENVLFVPPESFDPPPRVDSAVVRMVPLAQPPAVDAARLGEIVQVAFSQRRKILRHTLGKWLEVHGFTGEFDPSAAPRKCRWPNTSPGPGRSPMKKARRRRAFFPGVERRAEARGCCCVTRRRASNPR
jgi:16S rRNA (adenine1518-N6/adenine1519-N6)-dimethyltransferase